MSKLKNGRIYHFRKICYLKITQKLDIGNNNNNIKIKLNLLFFLWFDFFLLPIKDRCDRGLIHISWFKGAVHSKRIFCHYLLILGVTCSLEHKNNFGRIFKQIFNTTSYFQANTVPLYMLQQIWYQWKSNMRHRHLWLKISRRREDCHKITT